MKGHTATTSEPFKQFYDAVHYSEQSFKPLYDGFHYAAIGKHHEEELTSEEIMEIEKTRGQLNNKVRNFNQYEISTRIRGRVCNLTCIARNCLPPAETLRLMRYANAAHILAYIGFSEAYTVKNLFQPLNEKYHLLTDNELNRLNAIGMKKGGACAREVIVWILDMIYFNFRQSNATKDELEKPYSMDFITMQMMVTELLQMRGAIGGLYDYADQSIPFTYMHLLVLINGGYLVLMAYAIATYFSVPDSVFPDLIGAFMLLMNVVFVIGMREIGRHLIDPYGSEVQDLAVPSMLEGSIRTTRQVMSAQRFVPAELDEEERLDASRPALGAGYDAPALAFAPTRDFVKEGLPNYDVEEGAASPLLLRADISPKVLKSRSYSTPNILKSRSVEISVAV